MNLKELIIIVRPDKGLVTEEALLSQGAHFVTRQTVLGRGKEMGNIKSRSWRGTQVKSYPYLRKTMLSALVAEKDLPKIIKNVLTKNRTKKVGDGKIFVLPSGESQ